MGVANPRYRVVTFRLSSNEYEIVHKASEQEGARSLSDFARNAVLDRAAKPRNSVREQLRVLSSRSEQLFEMLLELDRRIRERDAEYIEHKHKE